MASGPRKIFTLKDEKGERSITVNMAYGLSVKWTVTAAGEVVFFIDREEDGSDSKERASLAHAQAGQGNHDGAHTATAPRPVNKADGPTALLITDQPKRRGRPRIHPLQPKMPATFGDINDGLDMQQHHRMR